jgi:acyl carrier protein
MKKIEKELEIEFNKIFKRKKFTLLGKLGDFNEWDSINHIHLLISLEKKFKIKFSVSQMLELKSIKEMIKVIKKKK